jgi:ATP-dependent exoDNAse (exonuclease V) beta subunit
MTFNFIKLPELDFDLKAETTESGRKYVTPNGAKYPSVTTVLSSYNKKAIMEWRQRVGAEEANKIAGRASRRGTQLHSLCEKYILGELTEMKRQTLMPLDKMMFGQLRPKLDKHVGNVYCLEQALYSDSLRLAGRVDLIAEWDGELSVIDFKSSTKEKQEGNIRNYFMQCSAYAEMFGEITNLPINKIVVAIATEEEVPQVFVKDKKEYLPELNQFIDKYWRDIAV